MVIEVGDKIRFSVELLEQIKADEEGGHTQAVEVIEIGADDGLKTIRLGRTRPD